MLFMNVSHVFGDRLWRGLLFTIAVLFCLTSLALLLMAWRILIVFTNTLSLAMKKNVKPWVAKLISSSSLLYLKRKLHEFRRRIRQQPHRVTVFIRVDDPYSYLLLQVMPEFIQRYPVEFNFHVVSFSQAEMYPEPELWVDNALNDAKHIAELYKLNLPDLSGRISKDLYEQTCAYLISIETDQDFLSKALIALDGYWSGDSLPGTGSNSSGSNTVMRNKEWRKQMQRNDRLLDSMGHYLSASLNYAGEWYWGIDRLSHLEQRLNQVMLKNSPEACVKYQENTKYFCKRLPALQKYPKRSNKPLIIYFSIRSPYSYLGLIRALELAEYYGINTLIKPVLPMLMRGMDVPSRKMWYIFSDTKREALKLGINYGFIADPLGKGVERCYALLEYAESENKIEDYLLSFAHAANAEGIYADTDKGLQKIVERAGLNWSKAKKIIDGSVGDSIESSRWRESVEENYRQMHQLGLWGVPSFQYDDVAVWGQDRIDVIEQAICRNIINSNQ